MRGYFITILKAFRGNKFGSILQTVLKGQNVLNIMLNFPDTNMSSRVPCPDSLNICAFCPLPLFSLCPMTVICLSGELNQELLETVALSCVMLKVH